MRVYYYLNRLTGDCDAHRYARECLKRDMEDPPNFDKDDPADRRALLALLREDLSKGTCTCGRLQIVVQLCEIET